MKKAILFALILLGAPAWGQTLIMGDSIFALNGEIERELERQTGIDIHSRARLFARFLKRTGMVPPIPKQYKSGYRTVIMDGGGNDVLIGNDEQCREPVNKGCKQLFQVFIASLGEFFTRIAADGVESVVFLGYYHPGANFAHLYKGMDHGMERLIDLCEA